VQSQVYLCTRPQEFLLDLRDDRVRDLVKGIRLRLGYLDGFLQRRLLLLLQSSLSRAESGDKLFAGRRGLMKKALAKLLILL
jgi:hypothetical protein